MINYPTAQHQGVVAVRLGLTEVARRVAGGSAGSKAAAATQIIHAFSTGYSGNSNELYPSTNEPLAQGIRSRLSAIGRHVTQQNPANRAAIGPQVKAFTDALGITIPTLVPAAPVALAKACTGGTSAVFSVDAEVPTALNYFCVSWFVNDVFVSAQDATALTIADVPDNLVKVVARLHSIHGTVDITWTVTTTPAPLFVDQSALNGVRVQVNVADDVTKQDISGLGKATLVAILNGDITLAAALAG